MLSAADELPLVRLDERFHNLIPSRFPPIDVFERIAKGGGADFAGIEALTNPRLREKRRLTRGLAPVDQNQPRFKNWNHAPFAYPNPEGSRFFGPERNVVELAVDLQTALAIAVARREAFLGRTAEPATSLEMRQIVRTVSGDFVDARGIGDQDKGARRALGLAAAEAGRDGILFLPPQRTAGTAVVVLKPACLGQPVQAEHFKFVWDGHRMAVLYSFGSDREYKPQDIASDREILAA